MIDISGDCWSVSLLCIDVILGDVVVVVLLSSQQDLRQVIMTFNKEIIISKKNKQIVLPNTGIYHKT